MFILICQNYFPKGKKGDRLLFLVGGFDKSNPYTIFKKVACPLFI
jgi:hypothetical protein